MKAIVRFLSTLVGKRPLVVLVSVVLLTVMFGFFSSQVVITDGNDGFAPDAEELLAIDRIEALFGESTSTSTLQIVISSEDGDVINLDGLEVVTEVQRVIEESDLGPLLADQPDAPAVISFLLPLQQAVGQGEMDAPQSDADVKDGYLRALDQLPPDIGGVAQQLLSGDRDLGAATASRGLVVVSINAPSFDVDETPDVFDPATDFADFTDVEIEVADTIRSLDLPEGFTAEPFSFELIFGTGDEFQEEVGRLFGMAANIIVVILLFVYLVGAKVVEGNLTNRAASIFALIFALVAASALSLLGVDIGPAIGIAVAVGVYGFFAVRFARWRRTNADMLLTMAAIFMAITWMNGIGVLMGPKYLGWINDFGPMNQIVPILLIGLGVDYAIHLTTRYREEAGQGSDVVLSMERAIHTVGIALILATVTTAVGFLTNLVSPIPALKDFGILAAVGIGSSFLIMLTFVAAFRVLLDRRAEVRNRFPRESLATTRDRLLPKVIGRTSILAERFAWPTVIVAVVLGVVGFFGVVQLKAEFSVTDFVPRPNPLLPTLDVLLDEFAGGFGETTQVIVEGDVDTPEAHNALAASLANLSDTENVLQFGEMAAADSVIGLVGDLADKESPAFDEGVSTAADAAGVGSDGSVSDDADVTALYAAVNAATPERAHVVIHSDGAGGYDALLVNITTQAGEKGAGQLADDVRSAFAPIVDAGLTMVPTSDVIINDVVITAMGNSQLSSLLITVLAAAALLMINFFIESRRPFLGLITIFPVALVMLWAFGLMPALGLAFGPVTATVSALAIGIGVPYMIHITHRFQEDRIRFATSEEAIRSTTTNTGGALAGSAFTTVAGFGILMTASLIPFQQLGLVTGYTILLALVGAVLLLPSMLVIWDRWHKRRGDKPVDPKLALSD